MHLNKLESIQQERLRDTHFKVLVIHLMYHYLCITLDVWFQRGCFQPSRPKNKTSVLFVSLKRQNSATCYEVQVAFVSSVAKCVEPTEDAPKQKRRAGETKCKPTIHK